MRNFKGVALFFLAGLLIAASVVFIFLNIAAKFDLIKIQKNVDIAVDIDRGSRHLIYLLELKDGEGRILEFAENLDEGKINFMLEALKASLGDEYGLGITSGTGKKTWGTSQATARRLAMDIPIPGAGKSGRFKGLLELDID